MEIIVIVIVVLAVIIFGVCIAVGLVDKEECDPICPCCDVPIKPGQHLCASCDGFINSLSYCKSHELLFEGVDCPKCQYSDFGQKR